MKPFDLKRAMAGDRLVTDKSSIPVGFVGQLTDGRIVVEQVAGSGVCYVEVFDADRLRMAPKKMTVYVNFWREPGRIPSLRCTPFDSESAAKTADGHHPWINVAIPVEIEE